MRSKKEKRTERSTESIYVQPSQRRARRERERGFKSHKTMVMQEIKSRVKFIPNKNGRKMLVDRKGKAMKKPVTVPLSEGRMVALMKEWDANGLGEIKVLPPRTIWHRAGITV